MQLDSLKGRHEEADTRMILHCVHTNAASVVVVARDTDVLILLLAHFSKMPCARLWMKAGTMKNRKFIPIHAIHAELQFTQSTLESILPFHALTGCDTVSYLAGHSKKTAWDVFLTDNHLISDLGKNDFKGETIKSVEKFVCKIYKCSSAESCDEARAIMFSKCLSPDKLPPTSDALLFHIQRAHYQSSVWRQANTTNPNLPNPTESG